MAATKTLPTALLVKYHLMFLNKKLKDEDVTSDAVAAVKFLCAVRADFVRDIWLVLQDQLPRISEGVIGRLVPPKPAATPDSWWKDLRDGAPLSE